MQTDDIQRMKNTGRLILSKGDTFWHYSIVTLFLVGPIGSTVEMFKYYAFHSNHSVNVINGIILTGYPWLIPAVLFYFLQRHRLKFKIINITVNQTTFKMAAAHAAKIRDWKFSSKTADMIEANRGFSWSGSWGERVTIIRDTNRILINSICDPDQRPSIASFGNNRKNIKAFEEELRNCLTNK